MKKNLFSLGAAVFFAFSAFFAQNSSQTNLPVLAKYAATKNVPTLQLAAPNLEALRIEDQERDKNGQLYRIGVASYTNVTTQNSGLWTTLPSGDRMWQLNVKSQGAEALSFLFDVFRIYDQSSIWVQDKQGNMLHKKMTAADVETHEMQNLALCFGDEMTLVVMEPKGSRASELHMDRVMYNYRSTGNPNVQKINESDACQVNVNCTPEGNNWQDEKRGVARIYVVESGSAGWCTGSLVNNTAQDCKPLFLTALHCGVSTSAANMNQWKFYFRYEATACTNPTTTGTLANFFITGCVRLADSGDGGGNSGSDFLLVQLGTLANQATTVTTLKSANFNAYWNGWDANNVTSNSGVSIHHPSGDIKKISSYSANLVSSTWSSVPNTHWRVTWVATTNGHGVTEGGSSGSPIFNNNGGNSRIIGTLTGGSSYCNATSSPDLYGKTSYHWTSNGTAANRQLKTYLDPGNTGLLVLDGSNDPCTVVNPSVPVANFVGNPLSVSSGGTVSFTDQTTGVPTSWSWTITPGSAGTDWSYTGGTSATSQNPQVIFNTVGQYTISLTASNSLGSDNETKNNYITVTAAAAGPCAATSSNCDEFIANVTLGTINNNSVCTNYIDYSTQSTNLTQGQQYTLTITPQITGQAAGSAYTDDEMAAYIDWNNDNDFDDVGERVAYVIVASGWSNQFTFTVPATASVGTKRMRVRLSYSTDDGPISPCGTSQWGEVEDYRVSVVAGSGASTLNLTCGSTQTITGTSGTVPNVTTSATASTTCAGGAVTLTQSPVAGTNLVNGNNVITVTATDNCGNTKTCQTTIVFNNTTGIDETNILTGVSVYPNPTSSELTIDLSAVVEKTVTIEVLDLAGKKLLSLENQVGSAKIDMHSFAQGMYQVRLTTEGAQLTKRVIKE